MLLISNNPSRRPPSPRGEGWGEGKFVFKSPPPPSTTLLLISNNPSEAAPQARCRRRREESLIFPPAAKMRSENLVWLLHVSRSKGSTRRSPSPRGEGWGEGKFAFKFVPPPSATLLLISNNPSEAAPQTRCRRRREESLIFPPAAKMRSENLVWLLHVSRSKGSTRRSPSPRGEGWGEGKFVFKSAPPPSATPLPITPPLHYSNTPFPA
jgi:hypothetical protein